MSWGEKVGILGWGVYPQSFGAAGEGYFRISAFNSRENVEEAMRRITEKFKA